MNSIVKSWKWLLVLALFVGAIAGCANKTPTAKTTPIKIGAILPLSGDSATYGKSLKEGMDLALDQTNKGNGINGRKLVVVYEDDAGKPTSGVNAFNKLISVDKVPMVIGGMFSAVTLAIAPVAESQKIVLLSPTSSAIELTKAGDYIFRIYPSDSYDGVFLADFATNKLKAKRISIIALQAASTSAITQVFSEKYKSHGGEILSTEFYKEGDNDFRGQLMKAEKGNPDVIFIPGYLKEMATLLRQAKELGIKGKFLSISTFYDPKILQLAGNAAEGVIFSSPMFDPKGTAPEVQSLVRAFKRKYGQDPDILAGYGYDVVGVAALALRTRDTSSESIKRNLYAIKDYPGVTGRTSFDRNGDVTKALRVMQVKNGKFVPF